MKDVIIIGGGLSGLSAAYELKKQGLSFTILEAQNRLGGRIETIYGNENTPMEMGATWFTRDNENLISLLKALQVDYFEQHTEGTALFETMSFEPPQQYYVPANSDSAYRVRGGTYSLINALLENIGHENVVLNTQVTEVIAEDTGFKITDALQNSFFGKYVIVALPPNLVINSIKFSPELPLALSKIMQYTQTWMSGSTKFSVEYSTPFWKAQGFSGSAYSQSGLAAEIYDHSNFEETKFALKGFLNGSSPNFTFEERREKVIKQLVHYFGKEAGNFISYHDKIWVDQYIQPENTNFLRPHQNNGHPFFQESYLNEKLFFLGAETSTHFAGYMEGAVSASKATIKRVLKNINL